MRSVRKLRVEGSMKIRIEQSMAPSIFRKSGGD